MSVAAIASPADLDQIEGFGLVAGDPVVATCDDLVAADPSAEEARVALIDGAALLMQVSPRALLEVKRRALRAMTLHYLTRLWRARPPQLKPELTEALRMASQRLATHLASLIEARRPAPLNLPRLEDVRVGVLRRRLEHFAPAILRGFGGRLAYVDSGTRLEEWTQAAPGLGITREARQELETLVSELRAAEAAGDAPRRARAEVVSQAAARSESAQAALELIATQESAAPPLEAVREQVTGYYDAGQQRFVVRAPDWRACLDSSTCTLAAVDLSEPLAPHLGCETRERPCSLKRLAAELYAESLAGVGPPTFGGLDAMRAWCTSSASERLLGRLEDLGRTLSQGVPDEGRIVWLLTPFERLDLVTLTQKKKGGWRSKRLTANEAEQALSSSRHLIAASILKGMKLFQDRRFGFEGLEYLGPALATLAGDDAVFLSFEGEIKPLAIEVAEPRLEAVVDEAGRAEFALTMGGVPLERAPGSLRTWVGQLDVVTGRLVLGHLTTAMRLAASTLVGTPATKIPPEDRERFAESLLALDRRVPVAPSKTWLGEAVARDLVWVLQLVWSGPAVKGADGSGGRALEARLRVKIVPELGAMMPGEGERVLPLKRVGPDGTAHLSHVERDLDGETRLAIAVAEQLHLAWPGTAALFDWRFVALEDALDFVSEAQALAAEGRIELVWDSRPVQVTRAARADRLQLKLGFRRDWLDVRGGFFLDGGELPLAELLRALREGKRFVALDEASFVELSDDLKKSLAPLASLARASAGKVVASPLAAPLIEELEKSGVAVEASPEWRVQTERMREAATLTPELPAGVDAELRPYQLEGFRWMARLAHWARGACLADDMGLGKTLQALVFMLHRAALGPTLVIAPTSVVANWTREAARFTPSLGVRRALQGTALDAACEGLVAGQVLVTTWDLLVRHERLMQAPDGKPWATVVFDEAHAMKNAATRRAQAARALEAEFVLALTGTPVENRPLELWSLFSVVAPGLLGSLESFRDGFGRDIDARTPEAARRLSRLIRPFLLRRTKAEVAPDLPPKSEVRVDVVLSGDERERYQRVRMAAIKELDSLGPEALEGQKGMMRVLAVLTRLRQLACHPRLIDPKAPAGSSKLDRLVELADELRGEGRKMLVFSQFTELLALVAKAFDAAQLSYTYLDGSTPGEERVRAVDRFQSGAVDAFLLSLKAGGVGLNLTAATEVIHLDPWWNPAVEDQASDRAHRIGQDKPVTIYRLVASGTIEEQILGLHADKREMVSGLLAGTGSARPLSSEDMAALLAGAAVEAEPEASPSEAVEA